MDGHALLGGPVTTHVVTTYIDEREEIAGVVELGGVCVWVYAGAIEIYWPQSGKSGRRGG